jgi:ubiquinone/menaquinone biosynthesis C-methylase UbiE
MKKQNHNMSRMTRSSDSSQTLKNEKAPTSWSRVSAWYDTLLSETNTYQSETIAPRLLRLVGDVKNKKALDLACGQGYFTRLLKEAGAAVLGSDISTTLIKRARELSPEITFTVASAEKLPYDDASFDTITSVLAFQNMEPVPAVFKECFRVLKKNGQLILVMNHPGFRVPQYSDWIFDEKKHTQERTIWRYLSEIKIKIAMNPSKQAKSIETISFHRPLQYWFKAAEKAGFVVTRLEEWESHKQSQAGPRKGAEDKARKEIPIFMAIVFKKL